MLLNMKYKNLIYGIGSVLIIAGAILKIMHLNYGEVVIIFGVLLVQFFMVRYIAILEKKIKDMGK